MCLAKERRRALRDNHGAALTVVFPTKIKKLHSQSGRKFYPEGIRVDRYRPVGFAVPKISDKCDQSGRLSQFDRPGATGVGPCRRSDLIRQSHFTGCLVD